MNPVLAVIKTPHDVIAVSDNGLYHVQVTDDGKAELTVYNGRAMIVNPEEAPKKNVKKLKVKTAQGIREVPAVRVVQGYRAVMESGAPILSPFTRNTDDDFLSWNWNRSRLIYTANQRFRGMTGLLGNCWVYSVQDGFYTFIPGEDYRSPHGQFVRVQVAPGDWSYSDKNASTRSTETYCPPSQNNRDSSSSTRASASSNEASGAKAGGRGSEPAAPSRGGRRP